MSTTGKYVPRSTTQTNAFSGNRMNGSSSSSAFGSNDNEYRQARRREAEAEAYRAEAERQQKKKEADAAKKKLEDSMNYASEEFYPTLGAPAKKVSQPQTQSKPVMNYKQKMVEAEEQRKLLITTTTEDDDEEDNTLILIKMQNQHIMNKIVNRPSVIHSDYYNEEQYEREDVINIDYTETEDAGSQVSDENSEDEQADELNSHVIAERRQGDKSLW